MVGVADWVEQRHGGHMDGSWNSDGWAGCMDVYVIQFHACNGRMDGMCPGVGGASSLKGTYVLVGGSAWLCGSHATVASDPHRYNGWIVVCCC